MGSLRARIKLSLELLQVQLQVLNELFDLELPEEHLQSVQQVSLRQVEFSLNHFIHEDVVIDSIP